MSLSDPCSLATPSISPPQETPPHENSTLSLVITDKKLSVADGFGQHLPIKGLEIRHEDQLIQQHVGTVFFNSQHLDKRFGRFGIPHPELYGRVKLYREKEGEIEDWTPLLTDVALQVLTQTLLDRGPLEENLCAACHQIPQDSRGVLISLPLDPMDGPRPGEWLLLSNPGRTPKSVLHLREGLCLFHSFYGCPLVTSLESFREKYGLWKVERLVRDPGVFDLRQLWDARALLYPRMQRPLPKE